MGEVKWLAWYGPGTNRKCRLAKKPAKKRRPNKRRNTARVDKYRVPRSHQEPELSLRRAFGVVP